MNNDDSTSGSSTTTQDSITYTNTFLFPASSEQTTVRVESKRAVPKPRGILRKHNMTVPTISPFDDWCDSIVVEDIKKEDVLDTVNKPICTTQ
jgi:hypothetical protein